MSKFIKNITFAICCLLLVSFLSTCSENDDPPVGGQWITKPGAVKMEINGSLQEIDKVAFEIPKDANHIDLIVYSDRGGLSDYNLKVENSSTMTVELLDPVTEDTEPYQVFGYGANSYERYRHTIRVTALDNPDSQVIFQIMTYAPYQIFVSEFSVVKKASVQ